MVIDHAQEREVLVEAVHCDRTKMLSSLHNDGFSVQRCKLHDACLSRRLGADLYERITLIEDAVRHPRHLQQH